MRALGCQVDDIRIQFIIDDLQDEDSEIVLLTLGTEVRENSEDEEKAPCRREPGADQDQSHRRDFPTEQQPRLQLWRRTPHSS
jgi:hypothetical protein